MVGLIDRIQVFLYILIIIKFNKTDSRCCPGHIMNDEITAQTMENLILTKDISFVTRTTIMELLEQLREETIQRGSTILDFDSPSSLSDRHYHILTGLNKSDFDDLLSNLKSADIRPSKSRTVRSCSVIFLLKMRTGRDNSMQGVLFNMSKQQVGEHQFDE